MEMPDFFHKNGDAPKQAHIHIFYQIIWFQQGAGVHYVDFKEYPITDNTLFFISPGQIHYFDDNNSSSYTSMKVSFQTKGVVKIYFSSTIYLMPLMPFHIIKSCPKIANGLSILLKK